MKTFKKLFILLCIFISIPFTVYAKDNLKICIDGNYIYTDKKIFIKNNRALVPIRVITENLGYIVNWDNSKKEILISEDVNNSNTKTIILKIGDEKINILDFSNSNDLINYTYNLDTPPEIIDNTTYIPIRAIGEIFFYNVNWDNLEKTIILNNRDLNKNEKLCQNCNKEQIQIDNLNKQKSQNIKSKNIENQNSDLIKANKNSKIYHIKGQRYFDSINEKNVIYFNSEEDAKKSGYKKSKI